MELSAYEVGEWRGWFYCRRFFGWLIFCRVAGHVVVVVVGKVAEGVVYVGEVQLADFRSGSVELGGDDFVVAAYPAVFEAGAVVFVFGEPFGVALHDVIEDCEGFACGAFIVVVGLG